ncbi:MAG: DUF885 family protein [Acidimicrobiales bacterium]
MPRRHRHWPPSWSDDPRGCPINPGGHWDFDTAVSVLQTLAFAGEADAASEVTRYMGWPGQAISYKLGEQAIVNLRRELESEPLDLKDFHTDILTVGAVGLDVLSEQVRAAQRALAVTSGLPFGPMIAPRTFTTRPFAGLAPATTS